MKITCNRREDIVKERDAYLADKAERQARYDEQCGKYREAEQREFDAVEKAIRDAIGDTFIDINIRCEQSLTFRDDIATVDVQVEAEQNVHDTPFSWRWSAKIRKGELVKESSSWSGMDVTTSEDVAYMKEVVRILEVLINMNWTSVLVREMPKYSDYIKDRDPRYENAPKDYNREIKDADVEDAVGKDILFEGTHFDSNSRRRVWYKIIKITPSQVQVVRVPDGYVQAGPEGVREYVERNPYIERVTKDKLYPHMNTESTFEY